MSDDLIHPLAATVQADVQHWLEQAVVGLNLCPFARAPHVKGQIHYAISGAQTGQAALQALHDELLALQAQPESERETTLLVFPAMFDDFYRFNDFLDVVDALLADLKLEGELQVASFHPRYAFADVAPDAISNATNQAPYPMLHLIRESSIDRAVASHSDVDAIPERNIALLEEMGEAGWRKLGVVAHVSAEAWLAQAAGCPAHAGAGAGAGAQADVAHKKDNDAQE